MKITHNSPYGTYNLTLTWGTYTNGQTRIQLYDAEDGMPYATATVCLEDGFLKEGEVAIKDYSENEGILETLIEHDIVDYPHAFIQSGYARIPICNLKKSPTANA